MPPTIETKTYSCEVSRVEKPYNSGGPWQVTLRLLDVPGERDQQFSTLNLQMDEARAGVYKRLFVDGTPFTVTLPA